MLREYAAFTSDLGVEAKVTDFCVKPGRLTDLMPTWMAARQARSPLTSSEELLESSEDIPRVSLPAQCTGDLLLPNAIPVPGTNHSLHSVSHGVDEVLTHYLAFYKQLKQIERILVNPFRKDRLIATCFMGTRFESDKDIVEKFTLTLHEPRWGSVSSGRHLSFFQPVRTEQIK